MKEVVLQIDKMHASNNQCFVACEARTMKPLLNETGCPITAVCALYRHFNWKRCMDG